MYICNNCNREFENYDVVKESHGEKFYVCPFCRDTDFDEVRMRSKDDKYLFIKKDDVIDFVVSALSFINKGDIPSAKETLETLIDEMIDSDFEYKSSLSDVGDNLHDVIAQLQSLLEVVRV